jgi:hypothetical protein
MHLTGPSEPFALASRHHNERRLPAGTSMNKYLLEQLKTHPSMEPQDIVKLCYQAVYGAEHLIADVEQARQFFYAEYEDTEPAAVPVYENISDTYCRVNIAGWKYHGRSKEELFELFLASAALGEAEAPEAPCPAAAAIAPAGNKTAAFMGLMAEYLDTVRQILGPERCRALENYLQEYYKTGIRFVRHSEKYRRAENPHYRLVRRDLLPKLHSTNSVGI